MAIIQLAITLGVLLAFFGVFCLTKVKSQYEAQIQRLLRNNILGQFIFIVASVWFLTKIGTLGEADFGQYRHLLLLLFLFTFAGCCIYWKDFLIVRGLTMLILMGVQKGLDVGYMSAAYVRPYLSVFFYLLIILALYFGVYPYRARDIIPILFQQQGRYIRWIGSICIFYGFVLIGLAFK